jgi:hypothetical protein
MEEINGEGRPFNAPDDRYGQIAGKSGIAVTSSSMSCIAEESTHRTGNLLLGIEIPSGLMRTLSLSVKDIVVCHQMIG